MWYSSASQCYHYKLLLLSSQYYKWRFLPSKPSAVIAPPFSTIPVLHLSICPRLEGVSSSSSPSHKALSSAERHCSRSATVRPPHPHFTLPWRLCVHMVRDYMWPLKHPVDEIICALWAMYWHHKQCALSCPLGQLTWVWFLKLLVEVKPASLKLKLFPGRAVDCCFKLICRVKKKKQINNMPRLWKFIFSSPLWMGLIKVHLASLTAVWLTVRHMIHRGWITVLM